jgi:hypothetical protein
VRRVYSLIATILLLNAYSVGQTQAPSGSPSSVQAAARTELTPEQIIQKFAEKETEFYEAWMQYTYTQSAVRKRQ